MAKWHHGMWQYLVEINNALSALQLYHISVALAASSKAIAGSAGLALQPCQL